MPPPLVKTLLAAVAVLFALFQGLVMLQVRGKLNVFPAKPKTLILVHRWGGRATLALVSLIGLICLYLVFGLGYPTGNLQVISHAVLGASAGLVLVLKVAIASRRRAYLRHAYRLGVAAGVLLAGAFAASGLVYAINRWA